MRIGLLIIICSLIITGCKNKNRIPQGIITPKKMQAVLWDMMRADQFLNDFVLNKDNSTDKTTERLKIYRQVFSIHQISREQFSKSFSFYQSHPALFKVMMDSISQQKNEAPTEMINPPVRQDTSAQLQKNLKDSAFSFPKKKKLPLN